jgi:hypothetical protein
VKALAHNSIRRFLALVVGLGLVVASLVATAPPAEAEVRYVLGGLDFGRYCHQTYSVPLIAQYGTDQLFRGDVYSWRCVVHQWNGRVSGIWLGWALVGIHEIDVHAACRSQYRRNDAVAAFRTVGDPYSWYCYVPVPYYHTA